MRMGPWRATVLAVLALATFGARAQVLDDFRDLSPWRAVASDDVTASVGAGSRPGTLRLAFDFRGHNGYAIARRALPLTLPENFELTLQLRGQALPNDFQVKLLDASGENVWWFRRADYALPADWRTLRIDRRQIEFAWGPTADRSLRQVAAIEVVVSAGSGGGAGEIEIGALALKPKEPPPAEWPAPVAEASQTEAGSTPGAAVDGNPASAWHSGKVPAGGANFTIDLGAPRPFGGLTLQWLADHVAPDYDVLASDDGREWATLREVRGATRAEQALFLPEASARYLRLQLPASGRRGYALADARVETALADKSASDFIASVAGRSPRGAFPRGYVGEQGYWTIVGTDGGADEGLFDEDAAFELRKRGPSLEPRVAVDGRWHDWASVASVASLADGYLPIPSVTWSAEGWTLRTTALADGVPGSDYAIVRYDYRNGSRRTQDVQLAIGVRPFQVNPPTQFLNGSGGVAAIHRLDWNGRELRVNDEIPVTPLVPPQLFTAARFDAAPTPQEWLASPRPVRQLVDVTGFASGAFVYRRKVAPGAGFTVAFVVPWTARDLALPKPADAEAWLEARQGEVAAGWHRTLDRVSLKGPAAVQPIVDTVRTALAHILINRDGPSLQPGSRSYERAWIRDGAMIGEALLRTGHAPVAREFLDWYTPYVFSNGKVPCCVDHRGADSVPENDSSGEYVWLADRLDRYTHDRAALERVWPTVTRALGYLDELRLSERTPEVRASNPAFYGMMPASISHEGYFAKPMHSYWDNFWTLAGLRSGLRLATGLEDGPMRERLRTITGEFHADLHASIAATTAQHGIDYLPGCAELGDFDPTSTTVGLSPAGETSRLPQAQLRRTFDRYWQEFVARRDGAKAWKDYTPYETRVIGSFVRLGWRDRAQELVAFFMNDRRPAAWNQWAEVVGRLPREPRFVGDMPHGWVASDFVRAALDLFAYEREEDDALVLAAGVDPAWLDGEGIAVAGLQTVYGPLEYSLRREAPGSLRLRIGAGIAPPGGVVITVGGTEHRYARFPVETTLAE